MEPTLAWYSMLPFATMLVAIAVLPLLPATQHWWERIRNQLLVALVLGVPVAAWMFALFGGLTVAEALVEYSQFIILLAALFTISGGIHLAGDLPATPRVNGTFLAIGALIASFIGTTGAAMLLIRPLLKTNSERSTKAHTVVFFIFTVANSGGLLTPLGDPPLFLGFLRGVPFTWTFHLFPEWLFVNIFVVATYLALDKVMYQREDPGDISRDMEQTVPLRVLGKINFLFLLVVVLSVAFVPSLDMHAIEQGQASWALWVPWREIVMISAMAGSLIFGSTRVRYHDNEFSWDPILEVAALFIGIFLTMIPALKVLAQVAPKLPLNDVTFFIFTGGLSSVLDNAPTYATFFEMAQALQTGSDATNLVAGVDPSHLTAISLGAVFCGALTYIGNGPNFMVKAVAEGDGVKMPSFGGYALWAFTWLAPILVAMTFLFIAGQWWAKVIGAVLTVLLVVRIWAVANNKSHTAPPVR
ncbi:MAG: sodium:proton antiporter [Propionibacteriaceae bacterium]|nr:sodium:proton antiporter [Propionibacteriaceae bacterium]